MAEDVEDLLRQRRYDEALERLLDGHEQRVFRMAVAMLRDRGRAQEVTQDIFLKLWRALPSYDRTIRARPEATAPRCAFAAQNGRMAGYNLASAGAPMTRNCAERGRA